MSPGGSQTELIKQRTILMDEKIAKMDFLMKKIDRDIGYNFWKKYVASAFWSQISTPINLVITFLTAITTAQAQTPDLIAHSIYAQLAIVSLIITTLNTFFRPHAQFATNTEFLQKWNDIGIQFEKEYYDKIIIQTISDDDFKTVDTKIKKYEAIQDQMNALRKSEGTNTVNFLTDLIFIICYKTCIRNYKRWMSHDQTVAREMDKQASDKKRRELRQRIDQERYEADLRISMARVKRYEEEEMNEIQEAHKTQNKFPRKTLKQSSEPSVFDLFDTTPPVSPIPSPPSTPPPPPPPQVQQPPSQLSIENILEVREDKN